jgi:hypothetical protein
MRQVVVTVPPPYDVPRDRIREWLASPPPDRRLYRSPREWADLRREDRD